jgi:hypothetical protein
MPYDAVPAPWRFFLAEVDAALSAEARLHCLGGFVVTAVYGMPRPTADIDVLSLLPDDQRDLLLSLAGRNSRLHRRHGLFIDLVTVVTPPEDFEQRLTEVFARSLAHLRLFVLDPYDLALCKPERNIERDRADVLFLAKTVPLDLRILEQRYREELRPLLADVQQERADITMKLWLGMIKEDRGRIG